MSPCPLHFCQRSLVPLPPPTCTLKSSYLGEVNLLSQSVFHHCSKTMTSLSLSSRNSSFLENLFFKVLSSAVISVNPSLVSYDARQERGPQILLTICPIYQKVSRNSPNGCIFISFKSCAATILYTMNNMKLPVIKLLYMRGLISYGLT